MTKYIIGTQINSEWGKLGLQNVPYMEADFEVRRFLSWKLHAGKYNINIFRFKAALCDWLWGNGPPNPTQRTPPAGRYRCIYYVVR